MSKASSAVEVRDVRGRCCGFNFEYLKRMTFFFLAPSGGEGWGEGVVITFAKNSCRLLVF
jgi:hypothetical protein